MKPNKKAKWIVGITGTTLSAFILSQMGTTPNVNLENNQPVAYESEASTEVSTETSVGSDREQELANKDWTNFSVASNTEEPPTYQATEPSTDRNTQRS